MVKEQLIINGVDVPLQGSLNPNITYNIQDIQNPEKRKSDHSKTVTLPGSKILNDLFNFIFEINIDGTFNPNVKASAVYLVDSQEQLNGYLKLNSIKYLDNSHIEYDCTLFGKTADFFTELGDLELTDIQGLNDFQHPYNATEQQLSWATTVNYLGSPTAFSYGFGYVYPLIDYGANSTLDNWDELEMYPAFYLKELWDRIFTDAGFTYNSSFLSTSSNKVFRRAIIPFNGDKFGLSAAQIADRTFDADTPSFVGTMTGITGFKQSFVSYTDVTDTGNIHNAGIFTVPGTGVYNLSAEVQFTATFNSDASLTEDVQSNEKLEVVIVIQKNGTTIGTKTIFISPDYTNIFASGGDTYTTGTNPTAPDTEYNSSISTTYVAQPITNPQTPNIVRLNMQNVSLFNSDIVRVKVFATRRTVDQSKFVAATGSPAFYYNSTSGNNYSNGTTDLTIVNNGIFKANQVNSEYAAGDTLDMYSCLPRKIKQRDFVKSILNMFNLFIEPDKDNPSQLNIEPRDDFYNSTVNDWSQKLDVSQDLIFEPMGLLDASRYIYTYKEDKDYYNQKYIADYEDIYGQREIIVNNEFLKNTYEQKVIFSPTPSVGQTYNDRVIPSIIKVDTNGQSTRTSSNIRILIYDGLKTTNTGWTHQGTIYYTYPYAGHFDDPFNPTEDLNFGLPYEIYYDNTYNDINVTNKNLYNRFHKKQLEEITDKDSKVVKGRFYLTPQDIAQLSFREQYFFNNAYHRLLKVNNYNPSDVALTECWFLKLKVKDSPNFINGVVSGGIDEAIADEFTPVLALYQSNQTDNNTYNEKTTTVEGEDNIIDWTVQKVEVYGDRNVIGAESKNVKIQGNDNLVYGNLENVTLINTSGVTVIESDVTYINGQLVGGEGSIEIIYNDGTVDPTKMGYEADTTNEEIRLNLPSYSSVFEGWEMSFKKINGNFDFVLAGKPLGTVTVDGEDEIRITTINDLINIYFDGVEYKIK
jgi:hypothetical protein